MTDTSSRGPRFDEAPASATRQVEASDWSRAEIEAQPEPPAPRERLFPRKVLVGWALFALALYFGVRIVGTVVKESVKEAIRSSTDEGASNTAGRIVIMLPNGKRITINREPPTHPAAPATATVPAPTVETAPTVAPAVVKPETPPAPKKR